MSLEYPKNPKGFGNYNYGNESITGVEILFRIQSFVFD